ncbi:hypothetical protein NMY22_g632 [Coprinellus aureogranulatus]|nr:hypothetical protein NMY22_g632 [Coprinellus aureogranulatus]
MVSPSLGALVALQVLACLVRLQVAWAAVVNRTIDDTFGDSETRRLPLYLPSIGEVWKGPECVGCAINPDTSKAFKNSYQAATYAPDSGKISITLTFNGTAIWVFFILANNEGDGITTVTDVNFAMDGESTPINFRHAPDLTTRDPLFNQLVYSRTDMPFKTHALEIFADANFNVYINFDYAIYTHDDDPVTTTSTTTSATLVTGGGGTAPTTTTSGNAPGTTTTRNPGSGGAGAGTDATQANSSGTPVGAIVGGVVGGILGLAAIIFLVFCLRRRRKAQQLPNPALMTEVDHTYNNNGGPDVGYIQQNAFQPGPSRMENGPLYSPVAQNFRAGNQYPNSMTTGSHYSSATSPYGGVAASRPDYDSDRATTVTGSASAQGTIPSAYSNGSSGAVISEKRRRMQQDLVVLSPTEQPRPSPTGADRSLSVRNPSENQQERIRQARQAEIGDRLRTVEREMSDLKRGRSTRAPVRVMQNNSAQDDEIADMREEMRRMQEEIMHLRSNQSSAWAQGLTDEPPPGYTPRALPTQPVS